MFELKRSEKIVEQIKLGDEIIEVNLDAGAIQARFTKGYNELLRAQNALNGATSGGSPRAGRALIGLALFAKQRL